MRLDIEFEQRVNAPPETVFFVDSQRYARWQGVAAELDPRPGGTFRLRVDDSTSVVGNYVELDPPNKVVYTWGWESSDSLPPGLRETPPGSTTIHVTLRADGNGTVVRVRHTGLVSDEARTIHFWDLYVGRLAVAVEGGDAGPDPATALLAMMRGPT